MACCSTLGSEVEEVGADVGSPRLSEVEEDTSSGYDGSSTTSSPQSSVTSYNDGLVLTYPLTDVTGDDLTYFHLVRSRNSPRRPLRIGQNTGRARHANDINRFLLQLSEAENYRLSQENGQRIFGPPVGMENEMLDYTYEVFISNIPPKFYEDKILPLFLRLGKLYTFRFMMNFNGENRGYAFAKFIDRRSVEKACKLNGYPIITNTYLKVVRCRNNNLLFVGFFNMNYMDPYEMFGRFTVLLYALKNVTLCEPNKHGLYSFILEFFSHTDTAQARRTLLSDDDLFLSYPKITVEWFGRVDHYCNPSMMFEWFNYGASRSMPAKITLFKHGLPCETLPY